MAIKLLSQICFFENFEHWENNNKSRLKKSKKFFEFLGNRIFCERTTVHEYVYKSSSRYTEKRLSIAILNAQKRPLLYYLREFRHFSDFQFFPHLRSSKSILGSSFVFLTKIWPKNMYHTSQIQNFKIDLFDLVTLDDLDLAQGHKKLRRALRSIQDTIHVVPSALFRSDTTALLGEASNDR